MSEKLAEVYEQYDMDILTTRKGRGATILYTTEGLRILEPFRGSITRLEQEYVLKQLFGKCGCENLDDLLLNQEGELLSYDKYRQPYVLKKHYDGNECDMHNPAELVAAIKALAEFHIHGRKVAKEFQRAWQDSRRQKEARRMEELKEALAAGEELEKISHIYDISMTALEELIRQEQLKEGGKSESTFVPKEEAGLEESGRQMDIIDMFNRHNKELKKIQSFIRKVKRKNSFETLFMQVFEEFYRQGVACSSMLCNMGEQKGQEAFLFYEEVYRQHYGICHGCFNQHNVLMGKDGIAIVHFERFSKGNQLNDLYQFTRKVMEKNQFDFDLLQKLFDAYAKCIVLTEKDYQYLYILFFYPEKFWKIANSYYNTNKAFLSPKYVEKLEAVILQETEKTEMLRNFAEKNNLFI